MIALIEEELNCVRESTNSKDPHAVAVVPPSLLEEGLSRNADLQ